MEFNWDIYKENIKKSCEEIKNKLNINLNKICIDRVNPGIIADLLIEYYEELIPLKNLANIQVDGGRTLVIKLFDKNIVDKVEKTIRIKKPTMNPIAKNEIITISFPAPTEENRINSIKETKIILEKHKILLRQERSSFLSSLKKEELPKDLEKKMISNLDFEFKKENLEIDKIFKKKESDLLKI